MKLYRSFSLLLCCSAFYGCQSTLSPSKLPSQPIIQTKTVPTQTSPLVLARHPSHIPLGTTPSVHYQTWLLQANHSQQVSDYKSFLSQHNIRLPIPDEEFFRSARDWQRCASDEFSVPTPELWQHMQPTLEVLNQLLQQQFISDIELTSSYRPADLNRCVGGAKSSSHLNNNAIDFRIGPPQPSAQDWEFIHQNKQQLCKFWQQQGKSYNMGLGVYPTGQIHIDTQGFRTWGADHTWHSSPCAEIIE
ncbi:YcbK family protein [Acinetobacter sp. MD2]|uniref:YcbK family protein n=1 Tax=Acinetobacter sp. MD2 TaxID=2600066 RepID=UPI002D1ECA50|nr:D-Ala-D-Ala carboxypeptidase family metallohydrolase [Acinetobacter sp. MD2]MEB3767883.1 peptidase M15 [Acinetobacter sp. MD2]